MSEISRRTFLNWSGAAAVASTAGLPHPLRAGSRRTTPRAIRQALPVVIASGNGLRGVEKAYRMMTEEAADPLDAALAGVNIQELDPSDQSVGLGGLPDERGVVTLDASLMHGPTRRAGAVAALEDIATPSLVAKAVMDYTDHVILVGKGARDFAIRMGFTPQNLLTEQSRQDWLAWKTRLNPRDNWLEWPEAAAKHTDGTIHMSAATAAGDLCSVTTTSGLAWKIPGRIGDSPIVGAGQYCDNTVGSAGATGRGEAAIQCCGSFLAVEFMRQGYDPEDACLEVLRRVVATTERRLLDDQGRPQFGLSFYAVRKDGAYGAATMYEGPEFAVASAEGPRLEPMAFLYARD